MAYVIVFVVLGLLLAMGVPIYISLLLASFFGVMAFTDISPEILIQRSFAGIDKFVIMSLPFFILGANAMDVGGLSKRIIALCRALFGHIFGGLAVTTQSAATLFGALSGSGPATVVAIGRILFPELARSGYPVKWASGLIVQAGSVSLLIPPSISLLLFASVTNLSVSDMFFGGLGAGLVLTFFIMVYIYIYARRHGIRGEKRASFDEIVKAFKDSIWSLFVPVIIIGGIFSGIFTPTEAAAVSAVYAILIGAFVYKEITVKKLFKLCLQSAKTTASVMILIAASSGFSWLLTITQFPAVIADFLTTYFHNSVTFLLFLNILLLLMGMVLEPTLALVIVSPLILPTAVSLGIDPVHLGVVICLNLAIGMFTPPFGLNIFVGQSITRLEMTEAWKGLVPFIIVSILALMLVTYYPPISLFFPGMLN